VDIIERALNEGRSSLSEHEAALLLASYGIPTARQLLVSDPAELAVALKTIGYPLVLKGCSPAISHKTERNLVRLDVRTEAEAVTAYEEIAAAIDGGDAGVLVQEMVKGGRELVVGLTRDPQFGPCVMFGLGGIFTEILKDVAFRLAPLEKVDAMDMMRDIQGHKILDAVRGMEKVDREALATILINVGKIGVDNERIKEIDINPLVIRGKDPVAVDALIVLH
jgi:acetate---CoA ligase (ADP-forming) subunit beta